MVSAPKGARQYFELARMVCFPFLKVICLLGRQMVVAYPSITEMCSSVEVVEMKGNIYGVYLGSRIVDEFYEGGFF